MSVDVMSVDEMSVNEMPVDRCGFLFYAGSRALKLVISAGCTGTPVRKIKIFRDFYVWQISAPAAALFQLSGSYSNRSRKKPCCPLHSSACRKYRKKREWEPQHFFEAFIRNNAPTKARMNSF
jgi:hypothetical protein